MEHPKKIHPNWYNLLCATATCYLDKLLRKRWNSTTSIRRFVCINASNTSEEIPRKILSPRSISFLAANFWGSSEAIPQKRTRGHEWHFAKKKISFESTCGSWNHTCTICSPAAFQIWNGTRLVSFLFRQLRALWSTGIKCSEGFRIWTI